MEMNFEEQIEWIDEQIETITRSREMRESDGSKAHDLRKTLQVLKTIKRDYAIAEKRSIELSWINSPDRMGK